MRYSPDKILATHDRIPRRLAAGMNVILAQGLIRGLDVQLIRCEVHVHGPAQLMF